MMLYTQLIYNWCNLSVKSLYYHNNLITTRLTSSTGLKLNVPQAVSLLSNPSHYHTYLPQALILVTPLPLSVVSMSTTTPGWLSALSTLYDTATWQQTFTSLVNIVKQLDPYWVVLHFISIYFSFCWQTS